MKAVDTNTTENRDNQLDFFFVTLEDTNSAIAENDAKFKSHMNVLSVAKDSKAMDENGTIMKDVLDKPSGSHVAGSRNTPDEITDVLFKLEEVLIELQSVIANNKELVKLSHVAIG